MSSDFSALVEQFLDVAIHLILRTRRVYAPEIFERRRFLDVTVFRSRHIELNEHIALVAEGAKTLLERGEADALVVSIMGAPREGGPRAVLERYLFEFRQSDRAAAAAAATDDDHEAMRAQLRGFLLKLHVCDTQLAPLPADADLSFACELHTAPTRVSEPLPTRLREQWTECDPPTSATGLQQQQQQQQQQHDAQHADRGGVVNVDNREFARGGIGVLPLKTLSVGGLGLSLSVLR